MRRIIKGEIRQIAMDLIQSGGSHDLVIESATYKVYDTRGEDQGLIEEGSAFVDDNRVSFLLYSTADDYERGKTYFARFYVNIKDSDKVIAGSVEVRVV